MMDQNNIIKDINTPLVTKPEEEKEIEIVEAQPDWQPSINVDEIEMVFQQDIQNEIEDAVPLLQSN